MSTSGLLLTLVNFFSCQRINYNITGGSFDGQGENVSRLAFRVSRFAFWERDMNGLREQAELTTRGRET